jgi:hypothetical protein
MSSLGDCTERERAGCIPRLPVHERRERELHTLLKLTEHGGSFMPMLSGFADCMKRIMPAGD